MSKLVKVVYDVAGIRVRYLRAHDDTLQLPSFKLARIFKRGRPSAERSATSELDQLLQRLRTAGTELDDLDESDLSVRRGREIRAALGDYVAALTDSVQILKSISELLHRNGHADPSDPRRLENLKIDYDDAMLHHNRLGARLNALIATL